MIFPRNVDDEIKKASTMSGGSRAQLIVIAAGAGCVVLYFLMRYVVVDLLQLGAVVHKAAYGVAVAVTLLYVFRFGIFKEGERERQARDTLGDTLAKYVSINKDSASVVEVAGLQIPILEFNNGNAFVLIEMKFGENNDKRANTTGVMLREIIRLMNANYLEYRFYAGREKFAESAECRRFMQQFNQVADKRLAYYLLQIAEKAMQITEEKSNVSSIVLQIRAVGSLQTLSLKDCLPTLVGLLNSNGTAFRDIRFLDVAGAFEFVKRQTKVSAIDFAMMKNLEAMEEGLEEAQYGVVTLLTLGATTGQVFDVENQLQGNFKTKARKLK